VEAQSDRATSEAEWVVRVAFERGDLRYYKRVDAPGPSDFTSDRGEARRYPSEPDAFDAVDRLKLKYPRIREIAVETDDSRQGTRT
jgi:hypothetical protein